MGVPERVAANAVRFSFGHRSAPADIDALLGAVRDTAAAFGVTCAAHGLHQTPACGRVL
jgi:cysteine sulfinate desulfinase/cysteine desulfurase-like protein